MSNCDLAAKALRIHHLLLAHYGEPILKPEQDPLSELVMTVLSQNTADTNTARAYTALKSRFPTWEQVLAADTSAVEEAIRSAGLAHIKAPRIQNILRHLNATRGALSLDFLDELSVPEARSYLTSLHGVGPKTAACVLLFALGKPALPVDTHVHRVTRRLGLAPIKASPEKTNLLLEELLPVETYYPFHLNVIRHGRTICLAGRPRCAVCPLQPECDYAHALGDWAAPHGQAGLTP